MRPAKSVSSIPNSGANLHIKSQLANDMSKRSTDLANQANNNNNFSSTSPICRCRVMYLGSSVPHITKDGLQGIQEPLSELYPDKATLASGNAGIDSWLSVWSNGILIENVDDSGREMKRFFKIDALHYCAAVKYVPNQASLIAQQTNQYATLSGAQTAQLPKFLPLDSPHARQVNSNPPIFASILRRTTGIKVLECHAFICKREAAANALVRCCFHAYADTMYAKQIGANLKGATTTTTNDQAHHDTNDGSTDGSSFIGATMNGYSSESNEQPNRRSKSSVALNELEQKQQQSWQAKGTANSRYDSRFEYETVTMNRRKSVNDRFASNQLQQSTGENLRRQQNLSKSMHHLNQNAVLYHTPNVGLINDFDCDQSTSSSCINSKSRQNLHDPRMIPQVPQQPPFYNPIAARVPSYPPQNMIDAVNNGGTLRSVKSMATNSIASTLMRSKKHAKAMSIAHLNQDKIKSFHQPHSNANTLCGTMLMPPIPPMFLPHLQNSPHFSGSQTMKLPSGPMIPIVGAPMNYETMSQKDIKKMLKKNAKYGLDPNKICENGLPMAPFSPPQMTMPHQLPSHLAQHNGSGTMVSQSIYSDICNNNLVDLGPIRGMPGLPIPEFVDPNPLVKPILVKPNAEFLKSKAGKKWVKQQKEFKKLLPPHLDGLPIVFGPPPIEALEPVCMPEDGPPVPFIQPPLPMMDASGYYNPNQFYNQNGRASAASTLMRYSPHSQLLHNQVSMNSPPHLHMDHGHRGHPAYQDDTVHPTSSNLAFAHNSDYMNGGSGMIYGVDQRCNMNPRMHNDLGYRQQKQNHMVEQSVISLGDENDYDDDEGDEDEEGPSNSYYDLEQVNQDVRSRPKRSKSTQSLAKSNQNIDQQSKPSEDGYPQGSQAYEQINYSNDDQSSYSSGIYKRGHLNERAFSYSIQQEHKSSGGENSDIDHQTQLEQNGVHRQEYQTASHNQLHSSKPSRKNKDEYYNSRPNQQGNSQVNELTARLQSQLNMKSFVNPRIKSHI